MSKTETKKPASKTETKKVTVKTETTIVVTKAEIAEVNKAEAPKPLAVRAPLTTATKITIVRLALLPVIMFFYLAGNIFPDSEFFFLWGKLIALITFVIASATDFLDGYIARKYNQVSDLGKLLDPIADKLLTTLGLVLIVTDPYVLAGSGWWATSGGGMFPIWFAVSVIMIALSRDFIVSFVRQIAAEKGIVYAANWSGKIKTTVQLIGIILVMFYAISFAHNFAPFGGFGLFHDIYSWVCVFTLSCVIILNIYSTVDYIVKYNEKVKEKNK